MALTSEQARYMDQAVSKLKNANLTTMAKVSGTASIFGASNSRDAAMGALKQAATMTTALDTTDRLAVQNGKSSFSWWDSKAQSVYKLIRDINGEVGEWGMTSVLAKTVNATVESVKDKMPSQTTLFVIGALIAIAIASYAVISVSPAINGVTGTATR